MIKKFINDNRLVMCRTVIKRYDYFKYVRTHFLIDRVYEVIMNIYTKIMNNKAMKDEITLMIMKYSNTISILKKHYMTNIMNTMIKLTEEEYIKEEEEVRKTVRKSLEYITTTIQQNIPLTKPVNTLTKLIQAYYKRQELKEKIGENITEEIKEVYDYYYFKETYRLEELDFLKKYKAEIDNKYKKYYEEEEEDEDKNSYFSLE